MSFYDPYDKRWHQNYTLWSCITLHDPIPSLPAQAAEVEQAKQQLADFQQQLLRRAVGKMLKGAMQSAFFHWADLLTDQRDHRAQLEVRRSLCWMSI